MTLYEKYGGLSTIHTIVLAFYEDVLDDELLSPYFRSTHMDRLIKHQTDFLSQLLGGPIKYDGRTLLESHKGLHITEEAFARVAELLQENLEDAGVIPADVQTIMGIVASAKSDIVG